MTIQGNTPGKSPYVSDDTRRWIDAYRVNNKVKPGFIFKAATDSNYINNQSIKIPGVYNGAVYAKSISNIISPGQRVPGCLTWSVSESLENTTQTASLGVVDALAQSKVSTTISAFKVGTGTNTDTILRGLNTNASLVNGTTSITSISSMPAQWHSTTIRYQWVQDGLGVSQQLAGNNPISMYKDPTLAQNLFGPQTFREDNLLYRIFEPEIIQVADISQFPDPAAPYPESEGPNEWWNIDKSRALKGVGAYYILVDQEVMRVVRIDRSNNYLFIIPGARGISGTITSHSVGATVTLLGFPPWNGMWTALGYLTPDDYKISQSPFRPGTCYVSYEGYGNPGAYSNNIGMGPFTSQGAVDPVIHKAFDRYNNFHFTGYWFCTGTETTFDSTANPQLTVNFASGAGHILQEQKIDPNNVQRSKNVFASWSKATFDQAGYNRTAPGDWYDLNMWDPSLPGAYPLTISTEYAQNKAFMDHMSSTNMGTTCEWCQKEWIDFVKQHEHGKPTGSIAEARAVGKHIYYESIRVYNLGGRYNAGPVKTFGRLMTALALAAWDNPQAGNTLGTRWTKIPNQLHTNMNSWTNGRVWNGQLAYLPDSSDKNYDWSNMTTQDVTVYGKRIPLHSPFTSQYDQQPWSQPMTDLADLNRMTYTISREGFPIFIPIGQKLRGMPHPQLSKINGYSGPVTEWAKFIDQYGNEVGDHDIGMGEWHLSYGGSIDSYTNTIDPSSVITLAYVSCQTAFGNEIDFTIPAAGTITKVFSGPSGIGHSHAHGEKSQEQIAIASNIVGNSEALKLTSGAQQTDAVSLDNLLLGLDWNTNPASWGLSVKRGPDGLKQVDSMPPVPKPNPYWNIAFDTSDSKAHPDLVLRIQKFLNFMMERRYIGAAVYVTGTGVTQFPLQLSEDGKFTHDNGKGTQSGITLVQQFLATQSTLNNLGGAQFKLTAGKYTYRDGPSTGGVAPCPYQDNPAQWGVSTCLAARKWLHANSEFIKTDIWWYVQNGLPWDQYIAAVTGFAIPQNKLPTNNGMWQIDQEGIATQGENWMKKFFIDAITYGNSIVDDSVNKAYSKTLSTNFADPRIQLGDVIWANIPGYMQASNAFGHTNYPLRHGIYINSISRSLDLQQGTYTASYQGYRYRGKLDQNIIKNPNNYVSSVNRV